jgi:signal transduction histidine kinase
MTEDDSRRITACADMLMRLAKGEQPYPVDLETGNVCAETDCLCKAVSLFVSSYCEMQEFMRALSAGSLGSCAPVRNQFFAAFKELQANLRHLVWQTRQVASGDLSQQVDFLGDFSVSFNRMIESLREKRRVEEELKVLNERLNLTINQLQSANEELESFSYSVSHDLRSPLHQMLGFAAILKEKVESSGHDDDIINYASIIMESAERMLLLIDELLAFSRLGRTDMKSKLIEPQELVDESLNRMQGDIRDRHIEWKIGALPGVYGDPTLLGLVVTNLISNAVKFTGKRDKAVIEIGCIEGEGEYIFHIKDNGAGFDMAYSHKLFGVFQRLHAQKDFEGTGVGLANVKRIISRHGGRVWAEGEVGRGATFYFTLPKSFSPVQTSTYCS